MITDHDDDMLLRCPHLGHEMNFGYCRQESRGKPCNLILRCWSGRFDVRAFLESHALDIPGAGSTPPGPSLC